MHGGDGYACRHLNLFEAQTLSPQPANLFHFRSGERGAAGLLIAAGLPGFDALREAHPLLFGNGGKNGNDSIPEYACAVEVLLDEGLELHARRVQAL